MNLATGTQTLQLASAFLTVAKGAALLLPPNVQLALALADGAVSAINAAISSSRDITDEELIRLLALDDSARADDRAAQAEAKAKDDTTSTGGAAPIIDQHPV